MRGATGEDLGASAVVRESDARKALEDGAERRGCLRVTCYGITNRYSCK